MYDVFDEHLVWQKAEDNLDFVPDPDDAAYTAAVLEATYYRNDLHQLAPDDQARARLEAEDAERRRLGAQLQRAFPGNWRKQEILFLDRDALDTRHAAVAAAVDLQ